MTSEKPKIGVFICHCGRNIGGYLDVPSVVEYAKTLPNVTYAEDNLYTCSEDGLSKIKEAVVKYDLNRVVVASCTPRTHAPLFQSTCEAAGVNRYLFEFVNIRDQCSWVHMKEYDKATEKAKDLVRMGVARVALLEPLQDSEIDVLSTSIVIGGGVAGMTAAINLANQGIDVHLIEKEKELGGLLRHLNRIYTTDVEAKEIIGPMIENVKDNPRIKLHIGSPVEGISGYIGKFEARVGTEVIRSGTIVLATGAEVLRPKGLFRYGELPNVVTQLEFETMLKEGNELPRRIAMIQCAGARSDLKGWRSYCSKVCCMVALKNAKDLLSKVPDAEVHIIHRDINATGIQKERNYHEVRGSGVRFLRYSPQKVPEVQGTKEAMTVKVHHETLGRTYEIPVDLVVLSTPLVDNPDNKGLSKMLKVPLDKEGFFLEAHMKLRPLEFATDGIYLCGTARFPGDVRDAISDAYGAAAKASIPMRKGRIKGEAITALVDPELCVGCGVCENVCDFGAPQLQENENGTFVSKINEILCKGCGVCAVSCPSRAITMRHYKDEQILAQIHAELQGVMN